MGRSTNKHVPVWTLINVFHWNTSLLNDCSLPSNYREIGYFWVRKSVAWCCSFGWQTVNSHYYCQHLAQAMFCHCFAWKYIIWLSKGVIVADSIKMFPRVQNRTRCNGVPGTRYTKYQSLRKTHIKKIITWFFQKMRSMLPPHPRL